MSPLRRWFRSPEPKSGSRHTTPLLGDLQETRDKLADLMIKLSEFDERLQAHAASNPPEEGHARESRSNPNTI